MSILALCPSRGRPDRARETLASFEATRADPATRLVFVLDDDDPTRHDYPGTVHIVRGRGSMGAALGQAARNRALLGDATTVGLVGDDNRFRSSGWDRILDEWLTANVGIAYGDDGFQHEKLPTSWWLSRPIVDVFGLAHPELRHFYMDNYWRDLGKATDSLRYFPDVLIEHLHPFAHKAKWDAIYTHGHTHARHDKRWYARWLSHGLAQDAARLRGLVRRSEPRRILADWHHPALWESLSILFEDQLGWELYSMGGIEWTRHGWQFEHHGWKAADYLVQPKARLVNGHHELREPEYPTRRRKLVSVEQAQAMRWDFVLASVAIHQRPFADLAGRLRARLIHHVGNARHAIHERVPQVVLASAILPRLRRLTVVPWHEAFDRTLWSAGSPAEPERVNSFMLRLDSASCAYDWLARSVPWSAISAENPRERGYLTPMAKVAARMAAGGWVWQDKKIGDGYGHVLHAAMAMGRPVIGHGSHYQGQLGAPYWRDLETCIDLDRHPPERALRLIRAISADPDWYAEMSANCVAAFEARVDFAAEAERVRAVLA